MHDSRATDARSRLQLFVDEIIFPILLAFVFLLFVYDTYYRPKDKTIPDLRLSEYAPDLASIPDEYTRKMKEKDLERFARDKANDEIWDEFNRQYREWEEKLKDAYAKRMLEGNPVTKDNPLTDYEMPCQPHRPFRGYGRLYY